MSLVHGALERCVQGVVIGFFAAQIFFHQVLIHLDDLVEHGGVAAANGVEIGLARIVQETFDDSLAVAAR